MFYSCAFVANVNTAPFCDRILFAHDCSTPKRSNYLLTVQVQQTRAVIAYFQILAILSKRLNTIGFDNIRYKTYSLRIEVIPQLLRNKVFTLPLFRPLGVGVLMYIVLTFKKSHLYFLHRKTRRIVTDLPNTYV